MGGKRERADNEGPMHAAARQDSKGRREWSVTRAFLFRGSGFAALFYGLFS